MCCLSLKPVLTLRLISVASVLCPYYFQSLGLIIVESLLTDTSIKRTLTVSLSLSILPLFVSQTDTSMRRTLIAVTESTLKSPILCVDRSPIRYGFCAGGKNYPVWCEQSLSKTWLAQLGKRRSAERDVAGSNPSRTNTQGL